MKLSQYCFLLSNQRGYFLFSTLFFSIIKVDQPVYQILSECKKRNSTVNIASLGRELYSILKDNGFLCNSFKEEYATLQQRCINARTDDKDLHLTIVPTMTCCFSCPYCFERHKRGGIISSDVMVAVLNYIKNRNPESLHITWFGGEPLLAIKRIGEFSTKLSDFYCGEYSSDIITTGFPINSSAIEILKNAHIYECQITIDGAKENHNKVKFTKQCPDTFTRIFDNIDILTSHIPEIKCAIRVNVTKENKEDIPLLHSMIKKRFSGRHVWLSPSLVLKNGSACPEKLFSSDEFRIITKRWWEKYKIPTKWIYGLDCTECAIRKPSAIVVLPDGSICRCWEAVGDKEYTIGILANDGCIDYSRINESFIKYLNLCDPFLNKQCRNCPYLPICFGGCPIKNIKRCKTGHKSFLDCTSYKNHLDEWLELYLDYCQLIGLNL